MCDETSQIGQDTIELETLRLGTVKQKLLRTFEIPLLRRAICFTEHLADDIPNKPIFCYMFCLYAGPREDFPSDV